MIVERDEDIETLTTLGLSRVQARVYLTLLRIGPSRSIEIAKASNVARPDIYRTISKLQELSLVEKILTIPFRFQATPIAEAIILLFRRREMDNDKLRRNAADMVAHYKAIKSATQNEDNQFILIPHKIPILSNTKKLVENAHRSVLIIIPAKKLLQLMMNSPEVFAQAVERNVNIKILTEAIPSRNNALKTLSKLNAFSNFELRTATEPLYVHLGVFDEHNVFLSTSAKAELAQAPALLSNNPDFLRLAERYFEILWVNSIKNRSAKELLATHLNADSAH